MSGMTSEERDEVVKIVKDHIEPLDKKMDQVLILTQKTLDLQREYIDKQMLFQSDARVDNVKTCSEIDNLKDRIKKVEEITETLPTPKRRQADEEKKMTGIQYIFVTGAIISGIAIIGGGVIWAYNSIISDIEKKTEARFETKFNAYLKENPIKPEKQEGKK